MLKLALVFSMGVVTTFYAAGRVTYSGVQQQLFLGAGLKVTPDPSNIWSFHETYTWSRLGTYSIPVLVDFDKNGKMDTELTGARVLITDILIQLEGSSGLVKAVIKDSQGVRWAVRWLTPSIGNATGSEHLVTPIALPIGSDLRVELTTNTAGRAHINLIGRLVSM